MLTLPDSSRRAGNATDTAPPSSDAPPAATAAATDLVCCAVCLQSGAVCDALHIKTAVMYTWFVYLANTGTKGFYIAQPSVQELPVEQPAWLPSQWFGCNREERHTPTADTRTVTCHVALKSCELSVSSASSAWCARARVTKVTPPGTKRWYAPLRCAYLWRCTSQSTGHAESTTASRCCDLLPGTKFHLP